jgi:hypothetical protein
MAEALRLMRKSGRIDDDRPRLDVTVLLEDGPVPE